MASGKPVTGCAWAIPYSHLSMAVKLTSVTVLPGTNGLQAITCVS